MDSVFYRRRSTSGQESGKGDEWSAPRPSGVFRLAAAICLIAAIFGMIDRAARHSPADAVVASAYTSTQSGDAR